MRNLIFIIVVTLIASFLFIGCSADMVDSEGREWYKMESLKVTFSSEDAGIEEVNWNDDNGKGFRSKWKKSFLHIQDNENEDYIMIMKTKEIFYVIEADIELSYKGVLYKGHTKMSTVGVSVFVGKFYTQETHDKTPCILTTEDGKEYEFYVKYKYLD